MHLIRRVRPSDGPVLRAVRLRALRSDPDAFGSSYQREVDRPSESWTKRAAESSVGDDQCLFVAETHAGLVGMVGAYTPEDDPLARYLFGMWVAPEARSIGIGYRLVEAITRWSIEGGAREVRLWVVAGNLAALRLYERAGFVKTGATQPLSSNPSLTEVLMRLHLGLNRPPAEPD